MKKFKLINIIGIDGSGKTTLAKSLADDLKTTDNSVHYRYCQYFAKLLYPIKLLAKLSVMRKTDEFDDYNHYNRTKKATSSRFPMLANIYAFTWLIDYISQVFFKVTVPILFGKKLIIDRYIFDIAVNLSLTTNNEIGYAEKLIRFFFILAPRPDLVVFIDLPEEVAYGRKDDIQSIEYLKERRERYLALAETYNFRFLDGTKSRKQMLFEARGIINCNA
jgi:thymidylate kinase